MENTTKAIMIGVALFIVIALITAAVVITNIGADTMRNSENQLQGVSDSVASQIIDNYNNKEMTGANVISAIKKFYNKENFLLVVEGTMYSTKSLSGSSSVSQYGTIYKLNIGGSLENNEPNISNLTSKIKGQAKYHSYVIYDSSEEVVLGIYFEK